MELKELNDSFMLYGALSVLDNRLQACENDSYPDMTMKQHFLMVSVNIFKDGFPTLKEASELIGCSYQNVKRLANQLVKKGYLHIFADTDDKRKLRLVPSEKFHELSSEKNRVAEQFMIRLYQNISPEELHITLKTIQQMIKNIETK